MEIKRLITRFNHYSTNNPKWIVIHDVGARGQAYSNVKWFSEGDRGASAHYFVDENETWQSVEDYHGSWHVGDDPDDSDDGINNLNSIGIEMCLDPSYTDVWQAKIKPQTVTNTLELTRELQKKHNIPNERVVRHHDASGKMCPGAWRHNNWEKWREFKLALGGGVQAKPAPDKTIHIVKTGDTLWGLAKQYNVTVAKLKEINGLNSDLITVGQQLKLDTKEQTINPAPVIMPVAKPKTSGVERSEKENGRFKVGKTLYVFDKPDETSNHVATYVVTDPPVVYHTIHYGNGYLWLQYTRSGGKGEGFIACRTYTNGKLGPMFGEILGDVPKPKPVAKKTYVKLSAKASEWRIYDLGVAPVAGKEKGKLRPVKFGGLEYEVLGYQDGGATAIIQTGDYGKGKIFLDSDATVYSR